MFETEAKSRVKLHKSGKSWVKTTLASVGLIHLLKGMQDKTLLSEENDVQLSTSHLLKATLGVGALLGGLSVTQTTFAEQTTSTLPVSSEAGSTSIWMDSVVVINSSTSDSNSQINSTPLSENLLDSQSINLSESYSISQQSSQSQSESSSAKNHLSASLSESISLINQLVSISDSQSTDVSYSENNSTNLDSMSNSNTNSTAISTTASNVTSPSVDVATVNSVIQPRMSNFSAITLALTSTSTSNSTTYTGSGFDKYSNVNVYYKLVVTNTGGALKFTYTVTYDNPDTTTVEKPNVAGPIQNSPETAGTLVDYGTGYGTITSATSYFTDSAGNKVATPGQYNMAVYDQGNGMYTFQKRDITGTQTTAGLGMVTEWSVPITNAAADLSYTFTPYATQDNTATGRINYFTDTITGTDPVTSTSISNSASTSKSASTVNSTSTSTSVANSQSVSTSTSVSNSNSMSTSESGSVSTSVSTITTNTSLPYTGETDDRRLLLSSLIALLLALGLASKKRDEK
ncbi:KxYKxGKxW signal peptide domain-containing protein [Streptococcus uberis]|uniref:KxYKxGKxW signal peptide domain-containing protein n=2 Tax=Streptococcus uberis TaxID=1349 RepID=UPI003D780F99